MAVRKKHIRRTVEALLGENGIESGPVPVEKIVEAQDIEIKLDKVDDDLSGFLVHDRESGRTVIGANKAHHKNRQRFTIAHELGHFFLHEGQTVHLDEKFTVNLRSPEFSKGEDVEEREANYFAAELLLPAAFLKADLEGKNVDLIGDGVFLVKLARKYQVSVQALTFRLANLGYISL